MRYRKILAVFLSVLVLISSVVVPFHDSEAFVPAAVLAPELVPLAGQLLVAAGVGFVTARDGYLLVTSMSRSLGDSFKQSLQSAYNSISSGVVQISDDLWSSVRSWVQSHFQVGSNNLASSSDSSIQFIEASDIAVPSRYSIETGFTVSSSPDLRLAKLYINNYYVSYVYYYITDFTPYLCVVIDTSSSTPVYRVAVCYKESPGEVVYKTDWGGSSTAISTASPVSYVGSDVLSNPTWDFKNETTGERKLALPPSIDDLVGKSYNDVIGSADTPADVPPDVIDPGATPSDSLLNDILIGVNSIVSSISSAVSSVVDAISSAVSSVVQGIHDLLVSLFVPTFDFSSAVDTMRSKWDAKLPSPGFFDTFSRYLFDGSPPKWYIGEYLLIDWANYDSMVSRIKKWTGSIMVVLTLVWIIRRYSPQQTLD